MRTKKEFQFMENSLDYIRLFAALQVAITHYLNLTFVEYGIGSGADQFLLWFKRVLSFFPGVVILFTVSGFLMGASLQKQDTRQQFLKKRVLRIYPGLWANVLFTAVVVFLVVKDAVSNIKALLIWCAAQALGMAYTPEFLKTYGAGSINGALWTIMVEVQFYLLIWLFWNFLKTRTSRWWSGMTAVAVLANLGCWMMKEYGLLPEKLLLLLDRTFIPYLIWFCIGIWLYTNRVWAVALLRRLMPILLPGFAVYKACWLLLGWKIPGYYVDIITGLTLPGIVIGCAYLFGKHRLKREISYGIFLYHWPVINLIFYYGLPENHNRMILFAGYTLICLGFAYISGVLIEQPCIKRFSSGGKGKK